MNLLACTLLMSIGSAIALPPPDATWEVLSTKPVLVECTVVQEAPWCRSVALLSAPIEKVADALSHMESQADTFESVRSIQQLDAHTLHVVLDFPGMMSDRDYVARYSTHDEPDGVKVISWQPVVHPDAPPTNDAVRLINMEGEWRLTPRGASTEVVYLWQAELRGSFPSWALSIAFKRTGYEVLRDLATTQGAELSTP